MTLRPATDEDRAAVLAIGVTEEAAWFGAPEVEADEVGEWVDDEGGVGSGMVAVDAADAVRGFVSPGRSMAVYLADPALTDEVADELLPWVLAQREGVELMTFAGDAARVAAFERHSLRHTRSSFTLLRSERAGLLPAATFPDGIEVAPYRLGDSDADDEAVHRLVYVDAAWASVPGHVERDFDRWRESVRPCTAMALARRDGAPAGWYAGRVMSSGRGEVDMLAVAASERGRGVGRALLLHGFAELQRAGAQSLGLGVQAQNDTALALYRSVGLQIEREWRFYAP